MATTKRATPDSSVANTTELTFTVRERAHAERVVDIVGPLVPALAEALRPRTEVVLHDLTRMPRSIVAIAGNVTGRKIGGPPTDLGLRTFRSGRSEHLIGYRTETPDGLVMRSSSIFFRTPSGKPVACLCINTDINGLLSAQHVLATLTAITSEPLLDDPLRPPDERFADSVETLAEDIWGDAVASVGVPIHLMKKAHKVEVVRELDRRGFFMLREAVDVVAHRLNVSRFTIYNYLNASQASSDRPSKNGESKKRTSRSS